MSPIERIPSLDLYRELEVDPSASEETIVAAYRSLMKRNHPDVVGPDGGKRSIRLNLAYEWLSDPERRRRYDAAQPRRSASPRAPTSAPTSAPMSSRGAPTSARSAPTRPRTTQARPATGRSGWQAHPRSPTPPSTRPWGTWPARWSLDEPSLTVRLGLAGIGVLAAALILFGWRSGSFGPSQATPSAPAAIAAATPTATPTARPTPTPTPRPTPKPAPTPTPSPAPTPTPAATPTAAGLADLRFSGWYAEHYRRPLPAGSACLSTTDPGSSTPTLTGFYLESSPSSRASWTLNLDGESGSWSMDVYFADSADALWWESSIGPGSVERTPTGFRVNVVLTDDTHDIRVQGTVTCD